MNHCQPAKCPNSCVLPQHRGAIDQVIGDARQLLTIQRLSTPQKIALQQEIGNLQRMRDQSQDTV